MSGKLPLILFVDPSGFEPLTSCVQNRYSNQLNYGPLLTYCGLEYLNKGEKIQPKNPPIKLVITKIPIKITATPINL